MLPSGTHEEVVPTPCHSTTTDNGLRTTGFYGIKGTGHVVVRLTASQAKPPSVCGLGDCAAAQFTNPFAFAMQIYALFAAALLSGLVLPQSAASPIPATHNCGIGAGNWSRHFVHASACTEAPPLLLSCPPGYLDSSWKTASPPTSAAASRIKDHPCPSALCGLGDCAAAQFTNPFGFAMQITSDWPYLSSYPSTFPHRYFCSLIFSSCSKRLE
ncbi:uncharacterized protein LOC144143278 [Haemaphysalis longicornis]